MKIFIGKVINKSMDKTAKVAVERVVAHPIYKKRQKKIKNYLVHDEVGTKVGDTVKFVGCKPISKMKRWKVIEVVEPQGTKVVAKKQAKKSVKKEETK